LDFGTNAFNGQARYLQIWVRPGSSTGGYTPLSPRQELTATPYALFSEAPWATNGITLSYTGGNVGIGTTTPSAALSIVKSSAPEPTAYGVPIGLKVGTPSGTIPFAVRQNTPESSTPGLALFETSDGNLGGFGANPSTFIVSAAASHGLGFNVNGSIRAMTVSSTGNLGIGTSSPAQKLHVSGPNSRLRLESTQSDNWTVTEYKTDGREWHTGVGGSAVTNGLANNYFIGDVTAGVIRLFIDYLGNVAIGTVNPCGGARLYVYKGVSAPFDCSTAAVYGGGENDPGVSGDSINNIGVSATSIQHEGLRAWSLNGTAVRGEDHSGTYIFEGWDTQSVFNLRFAVERATGKVLADGAYTGPADFAEMLPVSRSKEDYAPGDVLVIGADGKLTLSDKANATNLAGVYSAKPGFLGDTAIAAHGIEVYDSPPTQERLAVALLGIVPVKVTDENGPIHPGDLLTTSSTPGHAMKAKAVVINGVEIYPTGTILGKALESWGQGSGVIQVLITLR
jgi:hypothetical protein